MRTSSPVLLKQTPPFFKHSRMGQSDIRRFQIFVSGENIVTFMELLEQIYDTHAHTLCTCDGFVIWFTTQPHRTDSGIRVAARLCNMQVNASLDWN